MTIREIMGVALFAAMLCMIGYAYMAGYQCASEASAPVARYVSLGDLGKQITWRDESGCQRQAVVRGSYAS